MDQESSGAEHSAEKQIYMHMDLQNMLEKGVSSKDQGRACFVNYAGAKFHHTENF